jgi:hypothetical protein
MVVRNYNDEVLSGIFRKIKLPFLVNQIAIMRTHYSQGVHLKFYRELDEFHERRKTIRPIVISWHGLYIQRIYDSKYYGIEVDNNKHMIIAGVDEL